jgi:hypothetical protein
VIWGFFKDKGKIMNTQEPEALRIADALMAYSAQRSLADDAAAELRRLHSVNAELLEALKNCTEWMESLRASGDAGNWEWKNDQYTEAMAVIAKAQE